MAEAATAKNDQVITLPSDAAHRLAYVLQSIDNEEMRFAEMKTEHKDTIERLQNLAYKIRQEILTGQINLLDVMEKTAEIVNSGALDTKDVKVTAQVRRGKPTSEGAVSS